MVPTDRLFGGKFWQVDLGGNTGRSADAFDRLQSWEGEINHAPIPFIPQLLGSIVREKNTKTKSKISFWYIRLQYMAIRLIIAWIWVSVWFAISLPNLHSLFFLRVCASLKKIAALYQFFGVKKITPGRNIWPLEVKRSNRTSLLIAKIGYLKSMPWSCLYLYSAALLCPTQWKVYHENTEEIT